MDRMLSLDELFAGAMQKAVEGVTATVEAKLAAKYTEEPLTAEQLKQKLDIKNQNAFNMKLAEGMPFHVKGIATKYYYWSEVLQWEHDHQKHLGGY
jgi:hypothetical protein